MQKPDSCRLGVMFRREYEPEALPPFARQAEAAGFDELWVVEDCFWASGIAMASAALACTDALTVGLGIMPAVVRNPVFAAMEIATLARLYPGRFLPGIGHGVAAWMRQIGAFPPSQLTALEEVTVAVRRLLAGQAVTVAGSYVRLEEAELIYPPDPVPPVSLGVEGPKSMALCGRVADGVILGEYSPPAYVDWARTQLAQGKAEAGHDRAQRVTLFAFACAGETREAAHAQLRPMVAEAIASGGIDHKLRPLGVLEQARALREGKDTQALAAAIPGDWIDQLTIAGTPDDWRAAIDRFSAAGADAVVLAPVPDSGPDELETFSRQLE